MSQKTTEVQSNQTENPKVQQSNEKQEVLSRLAALIGPQLQEAADRGDILFASVTIVASPSHVHTRLCARTEPESATEELLRTIQHERTAGITIAAMEFAKQQTILLRAVEDAVQNAGA